MNGAEAEMLARACFAVSDEFRRVQIEGRRNLTPEVCDALMNEYGAEHLWIAVRTYGRIVEETYVELETVRVIKQAKVRP